MVLSLAQKQILKFLLVGGTTVGIDYLTYSALLWAGLSIDLAKLLSFLTGTLFAYMANRAFTFAGGTTPPPKGQDVFVRFLIVYVITMVINVALNHGILSLYGSEEWGLTLAFLVATGTSATLNFLGMKFIVFKM
jgi:putative flippase GtrA